MEDASVLAEVLLAAPTLPSALNHWASRRRPRVCWVQQESKAMARSFQLPAPIRNRALREQGDAMLRRRFAPLADLFRNRSFGSVRFRRADQLIGVAPLA
jgi:2-polyprenyl-6-methoxyphenol hydroxylase-like FAD-dependent oxidoreductase